MFQILSKVLFLIAIIFYTTEGLYINPVYDYFNRNKRGHTTLCVQVQPNGAGRQEPYFMCKGPELPQRQTPQSLANPTVGNYAIFNRQPAVNEVAFLKRNEEQNLLTQTLQFGNSYQQTDENNYGDIQIPTTPDGHHNPLNFAADYSYSQQNIQPSMSFPAEYSNANSLLSSTTPQAIDSIQTQPSLGQIKPDFSPATIANQEQDTGDDSYNVQDLAPIDVEHNIDPEQQKTLLEDVILGTPPDPDLGFSHDEMLSIQNSFLEPKIPLALQASVIPPDYFDDPVLRTFYNIDQHPHLGAVVNYLPPIMPEVSQKPLLGAAKTVKSDYLPPASAEYMPPAELTRKCFNWPFTFQPVFIAIPLFKIPYEDLRSSKQIVACAQDQNIRNGVVPLYNHIETNANKGSYRSEFDDDKNSSFVGIKTKQIEPQAEKTTSTKPSDSSEEPLFVEEITIKAEQAENKYDGNKSYEDTQSMEEEISTSTVRIPQTTAKSFKALLNAAKTHAVRYYDPKASVMPQSVSKRQLPYIISGVYPFNSKKQYVTKLGNNH